MNPRGDAHSTLITLGKYVFSGPFLLIFFLIFFFILQNLYDVVKVLGLMRGGRAAFNMQMQEDFYQVAVACGLKWVSAPYPPELETYRSSFYTSPCRVRKEKEDPKVLTSTIR